METGTAQSITTDTTLSKLKRLVITVAQLKMNPEEISDTANLFDDCGIDSTSLVDLVLKMEREYGIQISEDELETEMFEDISRLAHFIGSKLVGQP